MGGAGASAGQPQPDRVVHADAVSLANLWGQLYADRVHVPQGSARYGDITHEMAVVLGTFKHKIEAHVAGQTTESIEEDVEQHIASFPAQFEGPNRVTLQAYRAELRRRGVDRDVQMEEQRYTAWASCAGGGEEGTRGWG
ncbi:hypothetical protein JCM10450v2_007613 [Rhodotorula kratochvilovae]